MDILNNARRKVVCVDNVNLLWGDDPIDYLKVGKLYTVIGIEVYDWYTLVTVSEFPDKQFNSVLFEEVI